MKLIKSNMKSKKRDKIGLVLSGGGALGFAHIGVLEVLEENGIKIDYMAGTSMGGVVGALYSSGKTISRIKDIFSEIDYEELLDIVMPESGLISGEKFGELAEDIFKNKKFSDLKIPLSMVAYDLKNNKKIIFNKGKITDALRATSSMPGIFVPYKHKGMELVDGGIIDPLPISVVKDMGARKVIAVNLSYYLHNETFEGELNINKQFKKVFITKEIEQLKNYLINNTRIPHFILRALTPYRVENLIYNHNIKFPDIATITFNTFSISVKEISRLTIKNEKPDILINPGLSKFHIFDFEKEKEIINIGKKEAEKYKNKLRKLNC